VILLFLMFMPQQRITIMIRRTAYVMNWNVYSTNGPQLNWTHQLLVYADNVNLLRDNTDTIKENAETLIDTSKEVGLDVNVEKPKGPFTRCQLAGQLMCPVTGCQLLSLCKHISQLDSSWPYQ
jgi:hypothetical protein